MRVETISYLKQQAASLELDEPLVITQNGKAVYRIESEQQARIRDQGIALLKLMNFAERDIKAQAVIAPDDAKNLLKEYLDSGRISLNDEG